MLSIKRLQIVVVHCFLLIILMACSNNEVSNQASNDSKNASTTINRSQQAQGVTDTEIIVGMSNAQSGPAGVYDQLREGTQSYFNYVNENGGINGRKIKLIAYDDEYLPNKFNQNMKRLVETDKVFALVGIHCTPCIGASEDYLEDSGIPVVFTSGASTFVQPPKDNFFAHLMNYNLEAGIYLDYMVKELGFKNVYITYQNDDAGKDFLAGIHRRIEEYDDFEILKETPHLVADVDFSAIAHEVRKLKPDAVLLLGTPQPAAKLKQELYNTGLGDIPYLVSSVGGNDPNLFNLAGKDAWEGTYSSAPILSSEYSDNPSIKIFEERFLQDFPKSKISGTSQLGWAAGEIFVEGVKRAGDNLTWENIIAQLESFDKWDGSIYTNVTYGPNNRYGNTTIYMTQARDGRIVPISEALTADPNSQ